MKNILLPTDFSENSWNAIKYAIDFFEKEISNFYILHVNRLSDSVMNGSPLIATEEVIEDVYIKPSKLKLHKLLKRISNNFLPNKNHRFYVLSEYNFFISAIRKHVETKNIDIIVMGTKGASGLKKVIGSHTGDVITKVQCTTLAVPQNAGFNKLKEIVFPTDFSLNYDLQVLEPLLDILQNHEAVLRILHISKKKTDLDRDKKQNRELLHDYLNHLDHSFHHLKNNILEDAIQCFIESRDVNMICMVAKNVNYFQQILFHSKIEKISYHTEIPFLVLHDKN